MARIKAKDLSEKKKLTKKDMKGARGGLRTANAAPVRLKGLSSGSRRIIGKWGEIGPGGGTPE